MEVLGGAGERDLERRGELADRAGLSGECLQHGAAGGVGEGLEDGVQGRGVRGAGSGREMVNHEVEYTRAGVIVNRLVECFSGWLPCLRPCCSGAPVALAAADGKARG